MELKTFWTNQAIEQLEEIFEYYKLTANITTARKLTKQIVDRTIQLENFPESGSLENLLIDRSNKYRYLVEGNYKIIYWIEEPFVKIATIFDCRQNPINITKNINN